MLVSQRDAFADPRRSSRPPSSNHTENWGPYTSSGDFSANMFLILAVLFCTFLLALVLAVIIRFLLCRHRRPLLSSRPINDPEKPKAFSEASSAAAMPTLVFSAGTELAGVGVECAICLTEFMEGDGIKVLPVCRHGFHVQCIEGWLASSCSCPSCRRCCRVPVVEEPEKSGMEEP